MAMKGFDLRGDRAWVSRATGVFGALGHWVFIKAHEAAPAPVLAPFVYSQIIWMTGLGYLLFGDIPDLATMIGAAVIIGSGLYLLYRERRAADPDGM